MIQPFKAFLARYGLLLLWLMFGPILANAARSPGFVTDPDSVPYPLGAALVTWGILGIESLIIQFILRLTGGLQIAFSLCALLLVGGVVTTVTDMPGYYYVPTLYQLALTAMLGVAWVVRSVTRRSHH